MFNFLKRKNPFVTVRAEDLEVGDRFVYDNTAVEVKAIATTPKHTIVDIEPTPPDMYVQFKTVAIHRELLVTVAR